MFCYGYILVVTHQAMMMLGKSLNKARIDRPVSLHMSQKGFPLIDAKRHRAFLNVLLYEPDLHEPHACFILLLLLLYPKLNGDNVS